jgi:LAS superfamily LD-carboxypeptidase LdcB
MINHQQIMGVDDSHVCSVDEHHSLLPEVRDAFKLMQEVAGNIGLDFQICSSFRSFNKQLSIWNRKWRGELPLYTLDGKILETEKLSDDEKIHAIMLWSALPGASRHHWGTDFDFYDKASVTQQSHDFKLTTDEYEQDGPCAELARWVESYAEEYGFYLPYAEYLGGVAREPWHLSYQPIAQQIQADFDIDGLASQLDNSEMLGKEAVLPLLSTLVERYTYNKGKAN